MKAWLPFVRRHGATLFGLALLVGAIWVVQHELRALSVAEVRRALDALPLQAVALAACLTVVAYLVLAVYDWLGARYAGRPSSWPRALLASFCGYSLAHNLGFAAVSGAAVRYRLYSAWGYSPLEIGKIIGFTSLTFGLGGLTLFSLVLLLEPDGLPLGGTAIPTWLLQVMAVPMLGVVLGYILLSRLRRSVRVMGADVALPGVRLAIAQTLLAATDVAVTAAIFFVLIPPSPSLSPLLFIGIYLLAYAAGIAANVPGGLGVFDGAMMVGLAPHVGTAEVVGALLVFRLLYYVIPLFAAGALFAGFELSQRAELLARFGAVGRATRPLEAPALAGLVALGGALLIFLGGLPLDFTVLKRWAGYEAALASQFAASVVGSLLLVMAFGLGRRLRIAWAAAILLLLNGALITWLREEAWWTWGLFLVVSALLATMRPSFYRESRLRTEPLSQDIVLPLAAVLICGLALAVVGNASSVQGETWWEVVLTGDVSPQLRFTVAVAALLLLAGAVRLLRPARLAARELDPALREQLERQGRPAPARAEAVLWGEAGLAVLPFVREREVWIGQGDPAGDPRDAVSAIWRFRDLCDRHGTRPAWRDLGHEHLRVYADIGLQTLPDPNSPGRFVACDPDRDLGRLLDPARDRADRPDS